MPEKRISLSHKVLGVGNPFLDYLVEVSEDFLEKLGGTKGGMVSIDFEQFVSLLTLVGKQPQIALGGSGTNVIRGLAQIGYSTAIVGKIGRDAAAQIVLDKLSALNVKTHLSYALAPTSQVLCFITPDKERTMRSFLGAAQELLPEDIQLEFFKEVRLVHIEGYSLRYPGVTERAMQLAKQCGAEVSFDIGSFEIASHYRNTALQLIHKYVDILFANEQETETLAGMDLDAAIKHLSSKCKIVITLRGAKGCLVTKEKDHFSFDAYKVDAVDTTGAGDLFASGFLHGYLQNMSLQEAARLGCLAGATIVQQKGAEFPHSKWDDILS